MSSGLPTPSRYVVGLDLGTTNSALSYVDTSESPWTLRTFSVPQVVAPGHVEALETLPSFVYQPAEREFPERSFELPWPSRDPSVVVGQFARDHGTLSPSRLIASAKSWLCHSGVDRTADLLPWQGAKDVPRLSPVAVSSHYLAHYRAAWDAQFPEFPLAQQDFVLTLPASFDEVARELTIRAAQQAGLPRVLLIEEPQAAFYAWIAKHASDWEQRVQPGQKILVCDVGGGTSDFTLIRVRRGADGLVQFHRVAVGEHLILGGDNMDLALAHHLERTIAGERQMEPRAWSVLLRSCRRLKEVLLGDNAPENYTLTIPGTGSKLIGGSLQVPVSRRTVEEIVAEGFFPKTALDTAPQQAASGFQEFGLPYAADAAITRHLAHFLTTHRHAGDQLETDLVDDGHDPARPEVLLFNGGVFESPVLRQRVVNTLRDWFGDGTWTPEVLDHERLDLAVARGAAYYGMVRRGEGVRIAASLARSYYIGVEGQPPMAVCLCPATLEPGQEIDLTSQRFEAKVGQPIEFPLYFSSTRLTDAPGDVVRVDREQLSPLPPIRTTLKVSRSEATSAIPVVLAAKLTEIGTLDLWCHEENGKRAWKLLFDVRSTTQTDRAAHESAAEAAGLVDAGLITAAQGVVQETFAGSGDPSTLVKRLAEVLQEPRHEWTPTLLRSLWEALIDVEPGRRQSPTHEARWLNLAGYVLRPGYGLALDDWRVSEMWRLLNGKLAHGGPQTRTEFLIFWRRIAGGLEGGQQQALASPLIGLAKQAARDMIVSDKNSGKKRSSGTSPHEAAELWRLLGSLEWLQVPVKMDLARLLLSSLEKGLNPACRAAAVWAIGRMGARRPVYGPLNLVVPVEEVTDWINRLMRLPGDDLGEAFAVMQLARRTDDRYRDLSQSQRDRVLHWFTQNGTPASLQHLVREVGLLDEEQQSTTFGEALPHGLRIL